MDARSARPVLGDETALDAIARIDYDFDKFGIGRTEAFSIASRAGMDGRVFRLDPPPTVRWFDVDFPDVIDEYLEPDAGRALLRRRADLGLTLVSRRTAEGFVFTEDMDRLPVVTRLLYQAAVKVPLIRNLGQLPHCRF